MDNVNELGKYLDTSDKKANKALNRQQPENSRPEIARDIFDYEVPFGMYFRTKREQMQVTANVEFNYPPTSWDSPDGGLSTKSSCGDCYCSVCEQFIYSEVTNQTLLLAYPYVEGSVVVYDSKRNTSSVVESDPAAGIIDLNYNPYEDSSNIITVCYVYMYDTNCTTEDDLPPTPIPATCSDEICGITDTFSRVVPSYQGGYYEPISGWGISDSGIAWQGSCVATAVNGTEGLLAIFSNHPDWNDGSPSWVEPDWLDANVWGQQTYLRWGQDSYPMDITWELYLNRQLDAGSPTDWGEYLWIFFGDQSATGKFILTMSGQIGVQLILWSDEGETAPISIPVNMTQPFKIRMTSEGAGQPYNCYIWQSTNSQPTTPTLWITGTTWSNHSITIELTTENEAVSSGPLELHVMSIDIAGVDRCDGYHFDNFNRTVAAGGWGISTSGLPWGTSGSYETAGMSVNGTYAVVTAGVSDIEHAEAYIDVTGVGTAPWNRASTFTMRAHVFIPHVVASNDTGVTFRFITIPYSEGPQLWVARGSDLFAVQLQGNDGWDSTYIELATNPEWLNILWEVTPLAQHRVRIWEDGSPEPSEWLLTQDDTSGVALTDRTNFIVDVFMTSGPARSTYIDSIDFDYDGKPCYEDCAGTYDNFNRTVTNGWGTSDYGLPYDGGNDEALSVTGGVGRFTTSTAYGQMEQGVTASGPWDDGKDFTFYARFRLTHSNNTTGRLFTWGLGRDAEYIYCHINPRIDGTYAVGVFGTNTSSEIFRTGANGQWLNLIWEHTPSIGISRAKVYTDAEGLPTAWTVSRDSSGDRSYIEANEENGWSLFTTNGSSGTWTIEIDYIDFDYAGKCTDVMPA